MIREDLAASMQAGNTDKSHAAGKNSSSENGLSKQAESFNNKLECSSVPTYLLRSAELRSSSGKRLPTVDKSHVYNIHQ